MRISDKRLLKELQAEFRSEFLFLEMAFFKPGDSRPVNEHLEPGLRVGDIREGGNDGLLVLNGNLPAAAIEQTMADIFGLRVKVGCCKGINGHFMSTGKPMNELNFRAMHMAEEVVII